MVLQHGWNTTCFQLVNPKLRHWFGTDSVVGYVVKAGVAVVAGAPVCAFDRLPTVMAEFEEFCHRSRLRVCYFGAEQRLRDATTDNPQYCRVILGAQPLWQPQHLVDATNRTPSLRAQVNRALNKRVQVEEWSTEAAERNADLNQILTQWLKTRGLPPMHFLVEFDNLEHVQGRRIFVAMQDDHPIAFLGLSPIPARNGWLTEQFPRGRKAPNGTVDLLMVKAAEKLATEGADLLTMGIVPLATKAEDATADNPAWLRLGTTWARAHARRFYNFTGLEWFKDKFQPDTWEPIYAISRERNFSLWTLYAIAAAFTDSPPPVVLVKALWQALKEEVRRLKKK